MKHLILVAAVLTFTAAHAQQQLTPSQIAVQVTSQVGSLAQAAEQQHAIVEQLQKTLADRDAEIKALKEKYEPKPKPEPAKK